MVNGRSLTPPPVTDRPPSNYELAGQIYNLERQLTEVRHTVDKQFLTVNLKLPDALLEEIKAAVKKVNDMDGTHKSIKRIGWAFLAVGGLSIATWFWSSFHVRFRGVDLTGTTVGEQYRVPETFNASRDHGAKSPPPPVDPSTSKVERGE